LSKSEGRRRLRIVCAAGLALGAILPASAAATPSGVVNCHGSLAKATATADDANPLSYSFSCNGDIEAYTIVANREISDFSTLDDFSTSVTVEDSKKVVNATEGVACEAVLPGNGINCFANGSAPAVVSAHEFVAGSFDTTDPYCGVAARTVKVKGKKGKKGKTKVIPAEPRAVAQLVVSDVTGAEFGPFPLNLKPGCPAAHKAKATKTKTRRKSAVKATRR
jgi:hypothetical protein